MSLRPDRFRQFRYRADVSHLLSEAYEDSVDYGGGKASVGFVAAAVFSADTVAEPVESVVVVVELGGDDVIVVVFEVRIDPTIVSTCLTSYCRFHFCSSFLVLWGLLVVYSRPHVMILHRGRRRRTSPLLLVAESLLVGPEVLKRMP